MDYWDDNKVIEFTNWYIAMHKLPVRFELENISVIDSFLEGDEPEVWHTKDQHSFEPDEEISNI